MAKIMVSTRQTNDETKQDIGPPGCWERKRTAQWTFFLEKYVQGVGRTNIA